MKKYVENMKNYVGNMKKEGKVQMDHFFWKLIRNKYNFELVLIY